MNLTKLNNVRRHASTNLNHAGRVRARTDNLRIVNGLSHAMNAGDHALSRHQLKMKLNSLINKRLTKTADSNGALQSNLSEGTKLGGTIVFGIIRHSGVHKITEGNGPITLRRGTKQIASRRPLRFNERNDCPMEGGAP